jgi:CrcB protein
MRTLLLVALGGATGAVLRHVVGLAVIRWAGKGFPLATLLVNVVGSLLLGYVLAESHRAPFTPEVRALIGTGLCGALTTFSTFSVESMRLLERGQYGAVALSVVANLALGLLGAALGTWLARP